PLGDDPAWRLNLLSAVFGALAAALLSLVVCETVRRADEHVLNARAPRGHARVQRSRRERRATREVDALEGRDRRLLPTLLAAAAAAGLLAASHSFWLWAVQAKVYTLHEAFVAALFLVALRATRPAAMPASRRQRLVVLLALLLGASFTNHVM